MKQNPESNHLELTPKMLARTPKQHRREGTIVGILLGAFGLFMILSIHPMTAVIGVALVAAGFGYYRHEHKIAAAIDHAAASATEEDASPTS